MVEGQQGPLGECGSWCAVLGTHLCKDQTRMVGYVDWMVQVRRWPRFGCVAAFRTPTAFIGPILIKTSGFVGRACYGEGRSGPSCSSHAFCYMLVTSFLDYIDSSFVREKKVFGRLVNASIGRRDTTRE